MIVNGSRQPITRPEVDDVRGVDSGSAIKVLLDRELIKILGRKDDAGRPLLYGTTPFFLEFFGMNSMQELPTLREFTELSDEHRELFKAKTNEIGDLSAEADLPSGAPRNEDQDEDKIEDEIEDEIEDSRATSAHSVLERHAAPSEPNESASRSGCDTDDRAREPVPEQDS